MTKTATQLTPDATGDQEAPLLEIHDLGVEFSTNQGVIRALDNIGFTVNRGETLAVLGESGSGKSVTAQAIMGLLPKHSAKITDGAIKYEGTDLVTKPLKYVRELCGTDIAMIFQDPLSSLNPVFTVGYQIMESLRRRQGMKRHDAREYALDLMERVGIPEPKRRFSQYPHQFSGGMRQRIMIAIALTLKPKLLIADEPTTALDVTVQAQIMELLASIQEETQMGMMLITHDLGVVADIADRAVIMYSGRIAETGAIRDMYDNPAHPYTEGLLNSIPSDKEPGERLTPIAGSPPNLLHPPPGCRFAPRCPYAIDECVAAVPDLRVPEGWPEDQAAACIRTEEVMGNDQ